MFHEPPPLKKEGIIYLFDCLFMPYFSSVLLLTTTARQTQYFAAWLLLWIYHRKYKKSWPHPICLVTATGREQNRTSAQNPHFDHTSYNQAFKQSRIALSKAVSCFSSLLSDPWGAKIHSGILSRNSCVGRNVFGGKPV